MKSLVILAALVPSLASSIASAEYLAPRRTEMRPLAAAKAAKTAQKTERAMTRVSLRQQAEPVAAARGLAVDDVLAKINGVYMAGLQRCYRKSLALDPSLSGKVDLKFNVGADGRVTSALDGGGIERCLSGLMSTWRFGADGTVVTNDASFRISLVLARSN